METAAKSRGFKHYKILAVDFAISLFPYSEQFTELLG